MSKTTNYLKVIQDKKDRDPGLAERMEAVRFNLDIASEIYEARTNKGLSQKDLADLVGTTQTVISRMEDSEYGSHTVTMLRKISRSLGMTLKVQFVDKKTTSPEPDSYTSSIGSPKGNSDKNWIKNPVIKVVASR